MFEKLKPLLPGEDLMGLIGRSHVLGIGKTVRHTSSLLGVRAARIEPGLFKSKDFLVLAKRLNVSISELRQRHTCQEMMGYCLDLNTRKQLFNEQVSETIDRNCDVHSHPWRWCKECVYQDLAEYGVPYYHRDHQVPGVFQCVKHRENLIYACASCGFSAHNLNSQPIPPVDLSCPICGDKYDTPSFELSTNMKLIQECCLKMVKGELNVNYEDIINLTLNYIDNISCDYRALTDATVIKEFYRELNSYYSIDELNHYCRAHIRKSGNFCTLLRGAKLYNIDAKYLPKHPLSYALLMVFLENHQVKSMNAA
jgi:hypothetical protein